MKIKKLFAAILCLILLLSACGKTEEDPKTPDNPVSESTEEPAVSEKGAEPQETAVLHSEWVNPALNGALFTGNNGVQLLYFLDFDTMQSAPVCPRPNCKHDNPDECQALGMGNHPIEYGGNIYYFADGSGWGDDGKLAVWTELWRCAIDGSGKMKLKTLDNISVTAYGNVATVGQKLYFIGVENELDDAGTTGFSKYKLICYDFDKNEIAELCDLNEGYNSSCDIKGEFDGAFFILGSGSEEEIKIFNDDFTMVENWAELIEEGTVEVLYRYDLETGELSESDRPYPAYLCENYYICSGGEGQTEVVTPDGETKTYGGFEVMYPATPCFPNGLVFNESSGLALDPADGTVYGLNTESVAKSDTVIDYVDGSYIVSDNLGGFKKIAETDLFAGAGE